MSEPLIEKHAISIELSNVNREKHRWKSHRICRRNQEPTRIPIQSLKRLKIKSRKVTKFVYAHILSRIPMSSTLYCHVNAKNYLMKGRLSLTVVNAAMSSWSLIYYNTQGISSANDLIQIMNIGNQPYSSLSLLARQAYLMQSELPTAPNVFDTNYQLVLFTKKLLQRDISTVCLSKEPLSHSYLKATLIS